MVSSTAIPKTTELTMTVIELSFTPKINIKPATPKSGTKLHIKAMIEKRQDRQRTNKTTVPRIAFTEDPITKDNYFGLFKNKKRLLPDWTIKRIRQEDHLIAAILRARGNTMSMFGRIRKDRFDIGLEMSGHPGAFNDLLHHMFHGGKVALLGLLPAGTGVDWDQIIFKGLELHGIYGRRMYETWYKMTQMVLTGFPLQKAMTHHIPISDFQTGFDLMASGQCGKVVCDWTGRI